MKGQFAEAISNYLFSLKRKDQKLTNDAGFHSLLRKAATDPIMQRCQERFFHTSFWVPAESFAASLGCVFPLSYAIMYDSTVHGSRAYIVKKTTTYAGRLSVKGEQAWMEEYCDKRYAWLKKSYPRTTYRMLAFQRMMDEKRWYLDLPLPVHVTGGAIYVRADNLPEPAE